MASKPYRSLAPELIDMIFEELKLSVRTTRGSLKREHVQAIRCCLLVCMPFRRCAVRILFHHVEIITNDLPESGSQRLVLLRQIVTPPNPSLEGVARNIESVSISYKLPPRQRWPLPCQDHLHDLHEFLGHQDLIAVINALHREAVRIKRLVIDLAISGFQQQSRGTQWDKIDPRFRSALQDLARSPYLRYFRISDVHHVPLALLSDANFQSLRLRNSVFDQQDDYTHDLHTGGESYYPTLEAVFDHDGTASQQKLQLQRAPNELPSFQRLKEIVCTSHGEQQICEIWSIVRAAAETLQVISIEHNDNVAYPTEGFSLSHIPNLVSFSYSQKYLNRMDESAAALELARIHRILNLNGPMQRLETMELKIQSNSMGTPDVMIDPEAADQWRRIAELLAGPDYASLRKVKIDILFYVVVAYDIDIDMPIFNELMTAEMDSCFQNLARSKAGLQLSVDTWVEAVA